MKTFSLRRRLLLGLAVVFAILGLLVLAMDWYVVQHLVEHQRIRQDQPAVSLAREMFDTLPALLLPPIVVLIFAYAWLWRFLDRVLFMPLLRLSARLINPQGGHLQTMHVDEAVPEEVQALYEAYNRYVMASDGGGQKEGEQMPNMGRDMNSEVSLD